jgi:hypothetical protein
MAAANHNRPRLNCNVVLTQGRVARPAANFLQGNITAQINLLDSGHLRRLGLDSGQINQDDGRNKQNSADN